MSIHTLVFTKIIINIKHIRMENLLNHKNIKVLYALRSSIERNLGNTDKPSLYSRKAGRKAIRHASMWAQ